MVNQVVRYGIDAYPNEACGVLIATPLKPEYGEAGKVILLPNRSIELSQYTIFASDIKMALEDWAETASENDRNSVAVWHTHPQGNIGPSQLDMQTKVSGVAYLVVSLDIDQKTGIASWF